MTDRPPMTTPEIRDVAAEAAKLIHARSPLRGDIECVLKNMLRAFALAVHDDDCDKASAYVQDICAQLTKSIRGIGERRARH